MASRSERKAILAMVMVECFKNSLAPLAKKTLSEALARLERDVNHGFKQWAVLEKKHVSELHSVIQHFDEQTFSGEAIPAPVHTSFMLGLIDDLKRSVKNQRREAVEQIEFGLKAVHRYFDRHTDRFEDYRQADRFLQIWNRTLDMKGLN